MTNECEFVQRHNEKCRGARWKERFTQDAVRKVSFQSLFKSCQRHCPAESSKRSVQRQRKHGWQKLFALEERQPRCERGRVVRAVTENTLVLKVR